MDVVIRAAELGSRRARLNVPGAAETVGARPVLDSISAQGQPIDGLDRLAELRLEVESSVRAEFAEQAATAHESARARGHAEGLQQGLAAAAVQARMASEAEAANVRRALSAVVLAVDNARTDFERAIGDVAFAAVCRIMGSAAISEVAVLGVVEQVCAQLDDESVATARLHPRDLAVLQQALGEAPTIRSVRLRLVADEALVLGGCILDVATGQRDGSLQTQLQRLHDVLTSSQERVP